MHRTTTTATLLVTVALSALSGCVTVQRPPVSAPVPASDQPSAPLPDDRSEPQTVQAPALEALELIGPSRSPEKRRSPAAERPDGASAAPAAPEVRPSVPRARTRPDHPEPRRPEHTLPRRPGVEVVPDLAESVRENTDVCALGRKYGGWRADSPEARLCERTYGR
ncbi:hypothetical protein [Streptomyces sp. NPDC058867]|uniref:hypothetical protein n=1 Tax=unclassified Streptomyces TaxID=2593676 RepID=UPI0036B31715